MLALPADSRIQACHVQVAGDGALAATGAAASADDDEQVGGLVLVGVSGFLTLIRRHQESAGASDCSKLWRSLKMKGVMPWQQEMLMRLVREMSNMGDPNARGGCPHT